MYREVDIESDALVPAAVASAIGYSVYSLALPTHLQFTPLFGHKLNFNVGSIWELFPYTILALVLVVAAILYVRTFYGIRRLFIKVPMRRHMKPALGALLAGLIAICAYFAFGQQRLILGVLGGGYGTLQAAFVGDNNATLMVLFAVALGKILTTSLTIGSGGSGGVFGPSLVIGGCLGAATGRILHGWMPGIIEQPEAFAVVGMAGFFASCAARPSRRS